jgi:hypothetical protein
MLIALPADVATVLHRALATISTVCCLLVIASFAMFARDQLAGASQRQQTAELPNPALAAPAPAASHQHAQPRRFIDGAGGAITAPFKSVIQSNNNWVEHGIPAALALLVYGGGLGYLARFSRGVV